VAEQQSVGFHSRESCPVGKRKPCGERLARCRFTDPASDEAIFPDAWNDRVIWRLFLGQDERQQGFLPAAAEIDENAGNPAEFRVSFLDGFSTREQPLPDT
jgi:hypothetical protein